jgi:hypothetical protein
MYDHAKNSPLHASLSRPSCLANLLVTPSRSLTAIFIASGTVWPEADRSVMRAGRPTPRNDWDQKLACAQECDPDN